MGDAPEILVRFDQVHKSFRTSRGRRQVALDGFSMSIPRGAVVGLLGPNGSGKTTALKALLGLVRPDRGTITAFGRGLPAEQRFVARRMGALIEGPAFTGSLTGEHNLRLLGELHGADRSEIADVLSLVGLDAAARRSYSGYSLGMKQRLGVAAALLSQPDLLVLDEPMNGLDPEAVRHMRELLKRLRDERGMTVVVSSHILSEVELVSDWVTIVRNGRVICDASVPELLSQGTSRLVVRVHDAVTAQSVLAGHGYTAVPATGPASTRNCRSRRWTARTAGTVRTARGATTVPTEPKCSSCSPTGPSTPVSCWSSRRPWRTSTSPPSARRTRPTRSGSRAMAVDRAAVTAPRRRTDEGALPWRRLARAELQRLRAPRVMRFVAIGLPLAIVAFGLSKLLLHDADTAAAWRTADERYARFLADAETYGLPIGQGVSARNYFHDPRYLMDTLSFGDLRTVITALAAAAVVFGMVAGGSDWASRVMLTLAAAEPRRFRLFATRALLAMRPVDGSDGRRRTAARPPAPARRAHPGQHGGSRRRLLDGPRQPVPAGRAPRRTAVPARLRPGHGDAQGVRRPRHRVPLPGQCGPDLRRARAARGRVRHERAGLRRAQREARDPDGRVRLHHAARGARRCTWTSRPRTGSSAS